MRIDRVKVTEAVCLLKKVRVKFYLVLCLFLLLGCGLKRDEQARVITVDLSQASERNMEVSLIRSVFLETNDSVLIGGISKIKILEDKLYVLDRGVTKSLFLFDCDGKYLSKINRGKGPGEIIDPWDFYVDTKANQILVWDQATFEMKVYDMNLTFLHSIKRSGMAIRAIQRFDDDRVMLFSQFYPIERGRKSEDKLYDFFLYDKTISKVVKKIHPTNPLTRLVSVNRPFSCGSINSFISPFDYHLYEMDFDGGISVNYEFDLGRYQITHADLKKGRKFYRPLIRQGERAGAFHSLFNTEKFVSVSFLYKKRLEYLIYSKQKQKSILSTNAIIEKQLPHCKIMGITSDGTFIGVVDAIDYIEFSSVAKLAYKIDELSNQVIVFFKVEVR